MVRRQRLIEPQVHGSVYALPRTPYTKNASGCLPYRTQNTTKEKGLVFDDGVKWEKNFVKR